MGVVEQAFSSCAASVGRRACSPMINYDGWSNMQVIFSWHGTTLAKTWPNVLAVTSIALLTNIVLLINKLTDGTPPKIDIEKGHKMPLIFVSILLVFRCGYAFGRYMEGRGHVGKIVFTVRD